MADTDQIEDDFAGAVNPLAPVASDPPQNDPPEPEQPTPVEPQLPAEDPAPTAGVPSDPQPQPDPPQQEPVATPPAPKQAPERPPPPRSSPPRTVAAPQPRTAPQTAAPPPDGPQDRKAREFIEQAEKKLASSQSFFGKIFGGSTKKEEAADLFVRAANAYKVGKRYKAAGEAFMRAAAIHVELDVKHEAASTLVEAGQVLKKDAPKEGIECYLKAVEIYTDMGRFSLAARYHNTVAEIYETEVQQYEGAITHYEQASDFFKGEDSTASSNKAMLKVAHMCAQLQKYKKAADIFEEIGSASLGNNLLKYAAKDYFFKASLCHFCISPGNARDAIIRFKQIHPGFESSREQKLISDLLSAVDEEDTDKFADIVKNYDSISRVDAWTTGLLLHIKKAVNAAPDVN